MATFSAVQRQHILQAIAECDSRGTEDFLGVYGFVSAAEYPLVHEGREYDSRAVVGVAHRFATGRLATVEEFHDGVAGAAEILRKRGFDVAEPPSAWAPEPVTGRARPARHTSPSPRTAAPARPRRVAESDRVFAICPSCSMTLPATGVCDNCG